MSRHDSELLAEDRASDLVRACRTTVGDQLRSITYFTPEDYTQLYLRSDLSSDADLGSFVEHEAVGFEAHTSYRDSELGDYRYSIRVFEHGFLVRVTNGHEGVFMTTDGLTLRDFDEVAVAAGRILDR
jgi:hypothetical protein